MLNIRSLIFMCIKKRVIISNSSDADIQNKKQANRTWLNSFVHRKLNDSCVRILYVVCICTRSVTGHKSKKYNFDFI